MFWKKIIILYLALPMLFCLPSKAQKPGDIVSEQTIRNLERSISSPSLLSLTPSSI